MKLESARSNREKVVSAAKIERHVTALSTGATINGKKKSNFMAIEELRKSKLI